jgi:replicative DNA helicase
MTKKNLSSLATKDAAEETYRELPYNMQAEQTLLGTLLIDNESLHKIADFLSSDHFYEPVHQRIYTAIQKYNERGLLANPVTLKSQFDADEALKDLGGASYLAKLAGLATGVVGVVDYARTIYELAMSRGLIRIGKDIVEEAFVHSMEVPPSEQIEQAEQQLFKLASEGNSDKSFKILFAASQEAINRTEIAHKKHDDVSGIPTGFKDLDRMLGGLHDSDLLILAGRPSMGKTALAVNIAFNAAEIFRSRFQEDQKKRTENVPIPAESMQPRSVGVFSLEMSAEQIATRLLSMKTGINSNDIRRGKLDDAKGDFEKLVRAHKELHELPLYIDDTPALSIAAMRTRARRLKRKHNLGLIVVDYLQLMRGTSKMSESNRVQEVSEITQGLKAVAKELNIPVLALSQLSRAVEQRDDKRPQLADLRESGSIEQDADLVMFIFREQYYLERTRPEGNTEELLKWTEKNGQRWMDTKNKAEVIISKHRNGPIGNVYLMFEGDTTTFKNLDMQHNSEITL